jgi:AcrR family transcriptional regulator
MTRVIKEYAVRRSEILDVAQRLVYTKGYEQMTIQDILDDLQISKGAFYHYFGSKQNLLEALVERMIDEVLPLLNPIVQDPHLPALTKFQRYLDTAIQWKTAQKSFFLALLRIWYSDDNAIVRQKVTTAGIKQIKPVITTIIHQGIGEGVFTTPYPDQVGEVVLSIMTGLSEALGMQFLSNELKPDDLGRLESIVASYTDALERVLGAPAGSFTLVDAETLREWVVPLENNPYPIP